MVRVRVVLVVVHAEDDRDVRIGRGRRDHDLLRARVEVLLGTFAIGEEARRLEHDVDAEVAPRERGRVALGEHLHLLAGGAKDAVGELDLTLERAEVRVVAQEVRHRLRVAEVVQRDDLEVGAECVLGAEEVPPDAAEPVDADANAHLSSVSRCPVAAESNRGLRQLLESAEAPVQRRLRGRRVGAGGSSRSDAGRMAQPQLGCLAQRSGSLVELAVGAKSLDGRELRVAPSGSCGRGSRGRRWRAGSRVSRLRHDRALLEREHGLGGAHEREQRLDRLPALRVRDGVSLALGDRELDALRAARRASSAADSREAVRSSRCGERPSESEPAPRNAPRRYAARQQLRPTTRRGGRRAGACRRSTTPAAASTRSASSSPSTWSW